MAAIDMLIDVLSRSRERFARALDGVTVEQANTQPTPELAPRVDSLTWLCWHTARELNTQISALTGTETWVADLTYGGYTNKDINSRVATVIAESFSSSMFLFKICV